MPAALHRASTMGRAPAGRRIAALITVAGLGFASFAAAGSAAAPVTADCAALAVGSHGPAVQTIQQVVGATPDGDFGPMTKKSLTTWQSAHKVKPTGVVDAATWRALPTATAVAACGQQARGSGVAATCTTLTINARGPAVAVLQTAVRATGSRIAADGEYGDLTRAAVVTLQKARKLAPTGVVDGATWAALALTGTPACQLVTKAPTPTPTPTKSQTQTPPPAPAPADAKQQAAIKAQVVKLAADLPSTPGTTTNKIALQALAFAKAQTGKPYRWGGIGPASYDCSGLVMTSYENAAITTPRVAADQYGTGAPVPLDQAQAGDLLFYASDVAKPATIYHVVIYLGRGQILDAPYTGAYVGTRSLWTQDLLPVAWRPTAPLDLPATMGDSGWTVAQLQQALNRGGAKLAVDGSFGPATSAAVKAWQSAHKITANGVVDTTTWLSLA